MATLVSTPVLTYMRNTQADAMPDTCTIQTVARTSDGQGGWSEVWSNTYTSVACRVSPVKLRSLGEGIQADQMTGKRRYILTVAYDQAITLADRVVHGGVTYNVISVNADESWPTAKRAELERIE